MKPTGVLLILSGGLWDLLRYIFGWMVCLLELLLKDNNIMMLVDT